jgi:hypothetical protein
MPQTNKIKWHRDPAEAVSLYSDTDPTYSFMSDSMGRVYSVRDILNRYSNSPGKQVKDRMESRLRLLMGHPFWDAEDGSRVSPNEVLENPENENYKKHRERIDNADLSYPIMLRLKRNSEPPDVIDGVHRIAKYFKNKEQGESRPLSFRNVTAKEIQTALLASPGDKKGSHITTDVLNHLREQQRLQNLDKDAALLIGGIITKERPMESLQTNPYSPTAWEFISSQLGTKSAVQEKDAGWGD